MQAKGEDGLTQNDTQDLDGARGHRRWCRVVSAYQAAYRDHKVAGSSVAHGQLSLGSGVSGDCNVFRLEAQKRNSHENPEKSRGAFQSETSLVHICFCVFSSF